VKERIKNPFQTFHPCYYFCEIVRLEKSFISGFQEKIKRLNEIHLRLNKQLNEVFVVNIKRWRNEQLWTEDIF